MNKSSIRVGTLILILITAIAMSLMIGCSSDKKAWEDAKKTDTIEAYNKFIQENPKGKFSKVAKQEIEKIKSSNMKAGPWKFKVISFDTANYFDISNGFVDSTIRLDPRGNNKLALIKVKFTRIRSYTESEKRAFKKSDNDIITVANGMLSLIYLSEDKSKTEITNCLCFDGSPGDGISSGITSEKYIISMVHMEKNGESTEQTLVFSYGPWDKNPVLIFSPLPEFKGAKAARISISNDGNISVKYGNAKKYIKKIKEELAR